MALLTDTEAAEIRAEVERGVGGPILRKWIRLLLEDRDERVSRERSRVQPRRPPPSAAQDRG